MLTHTHAHTQAAVVLLPALEEGGGVQAAAVTVLELMVVHHKIHTAPALARMPPLPTHPALARINTELVAQQVRCVWGLLHAYMYVCVCDFC